MITSQRVFSYKTPRAADEKPPFTPCVLRASMLDDLGKRLAHTTTTQPQVSTTTTIIISISISDDKQLEVVQCTYTIWATCVD